MFYWSACTICFWLCCAFSMLSISYCSMLSLAFTVPFPPLWFFVSYSQLCLFCISSCHTLSGLIIWILIILRHSGLQEARNIEDFYNNFQNDPSVKIPRVYRDLSGPKVLVMEWIDGIRCTDPQVNFLFWVLLGRWLMTKFASSQGCLQAFFVSVMRPEIS